MINDIFYVLTNWLIDVIINFKKETPGELPPGYFYTFLTYFAETNPKYFPAMRM